MIVSNFKTMAERFPDCHTKELQQFKENAENSNPKKSTKTWLTVWTTWTEEKGYSPDIVSYEAKELDEKLQRFRRGEEELGWFRLRARQFAGNDSFPGPSFKGSRQQHVHCQGQRVCQQSQSARRESSLPP